MSICEISQLPWSGSGHQRRFDIRKLGTLHIERVTHAERGRLKSRYEAAGFVVSHHGAVRDSAFHVQSVNSYHGRLNAWIARKLRGVAKKYLAHYLAWMRLRSWRDSGVSPHDLIDSALGRQAINL